MNHNFLSLEAELQIQIQLQNLNFYLKKHPENAHEQALNYCEFFLIIAEKYKALETKLIAFKEKQSSLPSLPTFKKRRNK